MFITSQSDGRDAAQRGLAAAGVQRVNVGAAADGRTINIRLMSQFLSAEPCRRHEGHPIREIDGPSD